MQLEFEPIELQRQSEYLNRLAQCDQIASDYSFINIWGWQEEYGLKWAWQNELVWILQTRPKEVLWAPIGNWQQPNWSTVLKNLGQTCNTIIRIPEKLLDLWKTDASVPIAATEARDHWDYLYDRQQLIDLKGNRYHKKKNLVNQFKKKHEYTYLPFGQKMIDAAKALQEDWCTWRDCESNETLLAENDAITKVLNNWQHLEGITGGALEVNGGLVAYTIAEILPDNSLVIHFEKACPEAKGSYQAINQMFLSRNESTSQRVNREQDLGDEGLRKAKLSYHPVDYVRKYQATI